MNSDRTVSDDNIDQETDRDPPTNTKPSREIARGEDNQNKTDVQSTHLDGMVASELMEYDNAEALTL